MRLLRCGSFVASVMSDSLCIWILMFSCLFHGQVFVIPTGADAAMDAIQFALLACSSYDWASLERGFIVLQESLCRYHRRHASPTACMLTTSMTLLRRQRPGKGMMRKLPCPCSVSWTRCRLPCRTGFLEMRLS